MWQRIWVILGAVFASSSALLAHAPASPATPKHEVLHLWTELHHGAPLVWLGLGLAAVVFLSIKPLTK